MCGEYSQDTVGRVRRRGDCTPRLGAGRRKIKGFHVSERPPAYQYLTVVAILGRKRCSAAAALPKPVLENLHGFCAAASRAAIHFLQRHNVRIDRYDMIYN